LSAARYKLVWFVPREALDRTREAVFAAGAGRIGDYERCSWYTAGTGTFLAREGADPSIGRVGKEERVSELRDGRSRRDRGSGRGGAARGASV